MRWEMDKNFPNSAKQCHAWRWCQFILRKTHCLTGEAAQQMPSTCQVGMLSFVLSNDQIPPYGSGNLLLNEGKPPPRWEGRVQPSALGKEQELKGEKPSMKDKPNTIRAPLMSRDTGNIHCPSSGQFFLTQVLFFRRLALKTAGWKRVKAFIAMAIHFLQCLQTGPCNQDPAQKETQNCLGQGAIEKVSRVNVVM